MEVVEFVFVVAMTIVERYLGVEGECVLDLYCVLTFFSEIVVSPALCFVLFE